MARFNSKTETKKSTVNYMGEKAVKYSPELELVSILLTSFADESYYEKQPDTLDRLKGLIKECKKEFAAKAAVYARTIFGMRSISHVAASELAKYIGGEKWAKDFYYAIIHRPDDMSEILSYHISKNGKPTNAMKKGLGKAFGKFDQHTLAKYRGEGKTIKLVDVANIAHPKPSDKNKEAIALLMKGELNSTDTWESELTRAGQSASNDEEKNDLKKEVWVRLVKEKKIGYFALLRNLRNIMEQAPEIMPQAIELLTDERLIKKSLVLPFRYLTAYGEIEKLETKKVFEKDVVNNVEVLKAIEKAITLSISNLPILTGKTVILSDNSGSMRGDSRGNSLVSKMSNTKTADIANLFALMYWLKADNTLVGLFGDSLVHPKIDRSLGLFENFKIVDKAAASCGASTEKGVFDMFERLIKEKILADTIVIFSDCQIGSGCAWYDSGGRRGDGFMKLFSDYKKINPNFRCYSVDLKGYGTTVFDGSVIKISGWSEKIFDIMKYAEIDKNALINEINKITF